MGLPSTTVAEMSPGNKQQGQAIGTIYTDSIYTPVYNETRSGSNTDYDKLTLEGATNGTSSAKEAVSLFRAKILNEHLKQRLATEIMVEREETIKEKVLEMTIEEPFCSAEATVSFMKSARWIGCLKS